MKSSTVKIAALIAVIILDFGSETSTFAAPASSKTAELMRKIYKGDLIEVIKECESEVKRNPASIDFVRCNTLARMYNIESQYQGHEVFPPQALEKLPSDCETLSFASLTSTLNLSASDGQKLATKAFQLDKNSPKAMIAMAAASAMEGNNADFERLSKQALQLAPSDPEVNFGIALIELRRSRNSDAFAAANRWVKGHPDHALAYYSRAYLRLKLNKLVDVSDDLSTAIKLNPKFALAYAKRGRIYYEKKKYREAANDWILFQKYGGHGGNILGRRAFCFEKLGNYKQAISDYTEAIEERRERNRPGRKADKLSYLVARGTLYEKVGNQQAALADASQALQREPSCVGALDLRQKLFTRKGNFAGAFNDLTRLIEIDKDVAHWYELRSSVLKRMGKTREAAADDKRAKALDETGEPPQ